LSGAQRIDVVVATRDRGASLRRCLEALAIACARHGPGARVILVDNGSTMLDASALARDAPASLDLVVVREPQPGLSRARNAGLTRVEAEIVAFTDDDCLPEPDWLSALAAHYRAMPDIDAIGGWVGLADPRDQPVSIRTGTEALEILSSPQALAHLIGCNFSVRRAALARVGTFDPRLGAGTTVRAAEDLDLFNRLLKSGARIRYEPDVRILHAHGRRESAQIAALSRGYALGRGAFYAKHVLAGDGQILLVAGWEVRTSIARRRWKLLGDLARGAWLRLTGR
jgi:GT2 family glycosyltransferase